MSSNSASGQRALRIVSAGHLVFAATMIGLGIQGLIRDDFNVIWQPVPKWVPARQVLVYLCALIPLLSGIGVLWQRTAAMAARVLLAWFLIWLLLVRVPHVFHVFIVDTWWAACQVAVLVASAWVLYAWFATGFASGDAGLRIARVLYGLALIPLGVSHFMYLKPTAVLVPAWLPWHVFWAFATGCTFIAAGMAIVAGVLARLAAALMAVQIGLFTLLVWIPVVARGGANPFQWGELVVSIVLTACAWLLADSWRS